MSSNIVALPNSKADQSNIINHDKNSSDRPLTHVNGSDGQKKRRRKIHKDRCLEVAKARDTKEAPFDARDNLPESKALKSMSESMKKVVRFPDLKSTFADPYKQV